MNDKFSLNLLKVFVALVEHQSITKTAESLSLSQPAVSHALKQLRGHFNDYLFIKNNVGVTPTPKALALFDKIAPLIKSLQEEISQSVFEPTTSTRTFTIGMSDYIASILQPTLTTNLFTEAPNVTLNIVPVNRPEKSQLLDNYQLDCAIGVFDTLPTNYGFHQLFKEEIVCLAHKNLFKDHTLSMKQFLQYPHVLLDFREDEPITIKTILSKKGLSRQVLLQTPYVGTIGVNLSQNKCLSAVPKKAADQLLKNYPLRIYTMPISVPEFFVCLLWQKNQENNAELRWLRQMIIDAD